MGVWGRELLGRELSLSHSARFSGRNGGGYFDLSKEKVINVEEQLGLSSVLIPLAAVPATDAIKRLRLVPFSHSTVSSFAARLTCAVNKYPQMGQTCKMCGIIHLALLCHNKYTAREGPICNLNFPSDLPLTCNWYLSREGWSELKHVSQGPSRL